MGVAQRYSCTSLLQSTALPSSSRSSSVCSISRLSSSFHALASSSSSQIIANPWLLPFPSFDMPASQPPAAVPSSPTPFLVELVCGAESAESVPVPLSCMNRNKRRIGKANHGARPCNSVGRKRRTLNNKLGWRQLGLRPGQIRPALKGSGTPATYAETTQ